MLWTRLTHGLMGLPLQRPSSMLECSSSSISPSYLPIIHYTLTRRLLISSWKAQEYENLERNLIRIALMEAQTIGRFCGARLVLGSVLKSQCKTKMERSSMVNSSTEQLGPNPSFKRTCLRQAA